VAVRSKNSCGAGIELEQSSEPLATLNSVAALFGFIGSIREKELVAFALMIGFVVIMRGELGQGPGQRAFAEQNQLRQTLLLGGSNPTLRKGVQIRTSDNFCDISSSTTGTVRSEDVQPEHPPYEEEGDRGHDDVANPLPHCFGFRAVGHDERITPTLSRVLGCLRIGCDHADRYYSYARTPAELDHSPTLFFLFV
jgi:hypothetical protein